MPLQVLDHDDGVVDQHAQGDDHAGDGHLVQGAAAHGKQRQRTERDQRQQAGHQQAHARAHEHQQDQRHDTHAQQQRATEFRQPLLDPVRLVEHFADLERRVVGADFVDELAQTLADFHGIDPLTRNHHAQRYRRLAVGPDSLGSWLGHGTTYVGNAG